MQEYDEDGNEVIDFLEFYRVRTHKSITSTLRVKNIDSGFAVNF